MRIAALFPCDGQPTNQPTRLDGWDGRGCAWTNGSVTLCSVYSALLRNVSCRVNIYISLFPPCRTGNFPLFIDWILVNGAGAVFYDVMCLLRLIR